MKIAFCIGQLTAGGAERVVVNLANYLSKNNSNSISIISLRNEKIAYKVDDNVNIYYVDEAKTNKIKKNILRYKKLKKILIENTYDTVVCFLPEPSFFVLALKKYISSKIIVSVRNDPKVEYQSKIYNFLMNLLYPKADGFVFQTEEAKCYFNSEIQKNSQIILNSLNPNFIVDKFEGQRENKIVSVGRLEEQKNHKLLIEAFSVIHSKFPDYKLIIYGEGSLRKDLKKMIKDLKLEDFVFLPGVSSDIKSEIYNASIFVLSSNYEGLPNSLMEAMALGIPCISTDCPCGGPRSLITNNDNGILINVGNKKELIDEMENLINNKDFAAKISNNSWKIQKKVNPQKINKEWEDFIIKITNGSGQK